MTIQAALKKAATNLFTMVLCFIGRFSAALPICWFVYAWSVTGIACYYDSSHLCPPMVVMAPLMLFFGPIAHEEEDPPNHFLPVLLIAVVVTVVWTILALVRRFRRSHRTLRSQAKAFSVDRTSRSLQHQIPWL